MFKRGATSKYNKNYSLLGFRGEAIFGISQLCKELKIISKIKSEPFAYEISSLKNEIPQKINFLHESGT